MPDLPVQAASRDGAQTALPPSLLVRDLPGAVIAVDLGHRVVHWSPGAEALYGWTAAEALGQSIRELIGLRPERAEEVVATTYAGRTWDGEFATVRKDGAALTVFVSNTAIRGDDGEIVGVLGISLDITAFAGALAARAQELQDARQQAERLADRNARLVRVSEALSSAGTQEAVAQVVVAQAVEALQLDAGGLAVVVADRLRVLAHTGYEAEVVQAYELLDLAASTPLTDALRHLRQVQTSSRSEQVERYPHLPHSSVSQSFVATPLEVEGRVLGVLAVSADRPAAFAGDDLVFLLTLCRQGAQALDRLRLLTAERAAAQRMSFLAMASERLSGSLDPYETLNAVADLAVPTAGDWCSVHLLDESGQPELVTVHHRDPERQDVLEEIFRRVPLDLEGGVGMGLVITSERSLRVRSFADDVLLAIARDAWHAAAIRRLRIGSALGVPLTAHGRTFGVLTVASDRTDAYADEDVRFVEDLAHRISTAVDNGMRYRRERQTALTLQRSLLPSVLPDLPGLVVAHRYLPGTAGAEVGGDWYDLVPLTGGRVGLVIGDVMGRGIAAAAVMGQLRAAVRACALVEDSPSAVLALVDAAMSSLGQTSLTTCLYGVLDPTSRTLRLASSGHLPPLMVHRDGGAEYVELDPGPPLGVATRAPAEVEVELPDGALLLLFTDGLVHGRSQPVESGLLALRNAASAAWGGAGDDVDGLCDTLLRAVRRDGRADDDSALLAIWTGAGDAREDRAHLHLAGHLSEIARARRLTVEWAVRTGCDVDDAALLVTEVATNALRHGGPGVDLWLRLLPDGLRVEIVDGRADTVPQLCRPDADAEGGRGMLIVSALARTWGTERLAAGKSVWFEMGPAA